MKTEEETRRDIATNPNIKRLEELAEQLPTDEARALLFEMARSFMSIGSGMGTFVGLYGGLTSLSHTEDGKKEAEAGLKEHSGEFQAWQNYLSERSGEYKRKS